MSACPLRFSLRRCIADVVDLVEDTDARHNIRTDLLRRPIGDLKLGLLIPIQPLRRFLLSSYDAIKLKPTRTIRINVPQMMQRSISGSFRTLMVEKTSCLRVITFIVSKTKMGSDPNIATILPHGKRYADCGVHQVQRGAFGRRQWCVLLRNDPQLSRLVG